MFYFTGCTVLYPDWFSDTKTETESQSRKYEIQKVEQCKSEQVSALQK